MDHGITSIEDVPKIDLSDAVDMDMDPEVRRVQTELGTENTVTNVWEFEEGDAMVHHSHDEQEELYYVIDGEFRLKVGDVGDTEEHTVEEGDVFAFGPDVGRGYECVSDGGTVLSVGAPNVMDIDPEKYTPFEEA
jgi:quercetin dioxygenase-like cupin family protein